MAGSIPLLYTNPATGVSAPASFTRERAVTANTTLTAADNGCVVTNTGANATVVVTLPAVTNGGYLFGFYVVADQTLTVASAEGNNVVAANVVAGNSVSFGSGGDKIGGSITVSSSAAGTKWYVRKQCSNALTIA